MGDNTNIPCGDDPYEDRDDSCWACGGSGETEHDCMDDTCACLNPKPGMCPECHGEGTL